METTQTKETEFGTLSIGRTSYKVTKVEGSNWLGYRLEGVRGALYQLIKNVNTHGLYFAMSARGLTAGALRGLWFTDREGKIELVR